jgi:hypothetical protein
VKKLIDKVAASIPQGTPMQPVRCKAFVQGNEQFVYNRDVFSYQCDGEKTVGYNANVQFTVDRPAAKVWPVFKDFNLWQNDFGHYYSGAFGEKVGHLIHLTNKPQGAPESFYIVVHVIPEHLLVLSQPILEIDGIKHIGTHAFILTDNSDKTVVTGVMQHAKRAVNLNVEETIAHYESFIGDDKVRKWATVLGQALTKAVEQSEGN